MVATKILLITADDSTANNMLISLQQAGYKVVRISRGTGAIEVIKAEKPGLLILDVELPDYNSLAIIRALRSNGSNNQLPVILMGSHMHAEDVLLGLEIGADLCLMETFHPQVFVARVRSLLRRYQTIKIR
jgi:DNA-binding response OmpR family regulator